MEILGKIVDYDGETLVIHAPYPNLEDVDHKQYQDVGVYLWDGRHISPDQRKKVYALVADISKWSGHMPEAVKEIMKYRFLAEYGGPYFSLSDCDMTTAREFIGYLIDFCVEWDVPVGGLLDKAEDIGRYLYACVAHRKCPLCGRKADIHEYEAVGAGRNRNRIHHYGQLVLPLCRSHHQEAHDIGRDTFCGKYHIYPISLDEHLCRIIGWKI